MVNPVALQLGPLQIRWYGICAAIGFALVYLYVLRRGRKQGISEDNAADLMTWTALSALVGARAFYVITQWRAEFAGGSFWNVFAVWQGGLVFYGGFIFAAISLVGFCRIRKLPMLVVADLLAAALPLGHAVGRIGCWLNGCCYGGTYDGPLAVTYAGNRVGEQGPFFPIQLLGSAGNLALFGLLFYLSTRIRKPGWLLPIYMLCYATTRLIAESFRGDYANAHTFVSFAGLTLTPAQAVCLFITIPGGLAILAGVAWHYRRSKT
jgi:phosphatidylglycerol:prolipoprotein diacylglycerol transferase